MKAAIKHVEQVPHTWSSSTVHPTAYHIKWILVRQSNYLFPPPTLSEVSEKVFKTNFHKLSRKIFLRINLTNVNRKWENKRTKKKLLCKNEKFFSLTAEFSHRLFSHSSSHRESFSSQDGLS